MQCRIKIIDEKEKKVYLELSVKKINLEVISII